MASLKNTTINDTGYLRLPSGTTAQRPGSPVAGMMRYNSDLDKMEYYDGTYWSTDIIYESLTYTLSGNLSIVGNGTEQVTITKTSGSNAWNNQAYSLTAFTAPCTIEFTKNAATTDNGVSYSMISWNADPTTNASYTSLDYAAYPFRMENYSVYHNGSSITTNQTWDNSNRFYLVYASDGYIRHYNGSNLLYSVNYGTGNTVYVDSSFYSVNSFGSFIDIKVTKREWDGSGYIL